MYTGRPAFHAGRQPYVPSAQLYFVHGTEIPDRNSPPSSLDFPKPRQGGARSRQSIAVFCLPLPLEFGGSREVGLG